MTSKNWLAQALSQALTKPLTHLVNLDQPLDFEGYVQAGGYIGATKALTQLTPKEVLAIVSDSGLKGRGGAGFPTGMKLSCVPALQEQSNQAQPSYLICNGDEMEPGTFKDRYLL